MHRKTHFLLILFCISLLFMLQAGPPAAAQGGFGSWQIDLGDAWSTSSFYWTFVDLSGQDCDYEGTGGGLEISSLTLELDLDAGTVSGAISGGFDERFFDGTRETGQISGQVIDGWVEWDGHGGGDWIFGGTWQTQISAEDVYECWNNDLSTYEELIETKSREILIPFTGYTLDAGHVGGKIAKIKGLFEDPAEKLTVSIAVMDIPLPEGFPNYSEGGPPVVIDLPELDVSLAVADLLNSRDEIVFTANVVGGDPNELTYSWYVDGFYWATTYEPVWAWDDPITGVSVAEVEVYDDTRSAWAELAFTFDGENIWEGELDTEPAEEPLEVSIGCSPGKPTDDDAVTCTATATGQQPDELIEYQWYLNSRFVGDSTSPSWDFGVLDRGNQYISVQAAGEGRTAEAELTLSIAASDTIEPAPEIQDQPDAQFEITLGCDQQISSDDNLVCTVRIDAPEGVEELAVTWVLDGAVAEQDTALGSASFQPGKLPPGTHTVEVQVVNTDNGQARVAQTSVEVEMGQNVAPFVDTDDDENETIPAASQAAAAVGSTTAVGAWLWLEWWLARRAQALEKRADRQLAQDRQQWFDDVEKINQAEREQRAQLEAAQAMLADTWKKQYQKMLENAWQNPREEYLVDVMDRHLADIYRDGQWDAGEMDRFFGTLGRMQAIQRDFDRHNAWIKHLERNRSAALDAVVETARSGWVTAARVVSNAVTLGAAEGVWMPVTATISALDARSRVLLQGKQGAEAGWAVLKQSGKGLAADYLIGKVVSTGSQAFTPEIAAAKDWLKTQTPTFQQFGRWVGGRAGGAGQALADWTPESAQRLWRTLNTPLDKLARNALDSFRGQPAGQLPVIRQEWGRPVTYTSDPVYHPDFVPDVPVGWVNRLRQLETINPDLADDVARAMASAADGGLDMPSNNLLSAGQRFTLTPDETVGMSLANNPGYRRALSEGLIPRQAHELVNVARDKAAKNAVMAAYESLDESVRRQITRIEFTGTGARPRSPAATSGWTDLDMTVRGTPEAERAFQRAFYDQLEQQGLDRNVADVNMFDGLRPSPSAPPRGGYGSEEMINWQEADVTGRARCAVPTEKGGMVFEAHPDVRPVEGQGQLDPVPRWTGTPSATRDARRVLLEHVEEMPQHLGRPPTRLDVLRSEGKHAGRVWWTENKGQGLSRPNWIRSLDRWKADRTFSPSQDEVDQVWQQFVDYFQLGDEMRGIQ